MSVLLNGYSEGVIGLTRHNEIWQEFAFQATNLIRCDTSHAVRIASSEKIRELV
jgi:hypothetical protein